MKIYNTDSQPEFHYFAIQPKSGKINFIKYFVNIYIVCVMPESYKKIGKKTIFQ